MKLKVTTLLWLIIFTLPTRAEDLLPADFTSIYKLYRDDVLVGEMVRSLSRQGTDYIFKSESKTTGLVALFHKDNMMESTRWRVKDGVFLPQKYDYFRERKNKERKVSIQFDWQKQRIITDVNGSSWKMPVEENIYDKLLYQLAIMVNLKQGKKVEEFRVADGGKVKTYFFENLGSDAVKTPIGEFKTTRLSRHKSGKDEKLTLWFAEKLHYLPIKVESISEDDVVITAVIEEFTQQ